MLAGMNGFSLASHRNQPQYTTTNANSAGAEGG
jgi:hypothetical protein